MGTAVSYVIDIRNVAKSFKRQTHTKSGYGSFKSFLINRLLGRTKSEPEKSSTTHAIKDLTLRIPKGASFGVIGQNGSGKSTLLKLISGIYKPDTGSISVSGRVAALIELGAGFHPDFTGRENLFLGGIMHGLTKAQVQERFDKIVKFAELEDVIDDPVRTYSSGMFMRLGFSLAVHTDPDILIIDEVLAVGDAAFVGKCKEKIAALKREGKTLLLVTHDLAAVERWCDEALWLRNGEAKDRGEPRRVIDHYLQYIEQNEEEELFEENKIEATDLAEPTQHSSQDKARWGSREIEITTIGLVSQNSNEHRLFHPEDPLEIQFSYKVNDKNLIDSSDLVFGIGIHRSDGLVVYASNTEIEKLQLPSIESDGIVRFKIERLGLLEGNFRLDIAVHRKDGYPYDYHQGAIFFGMRSPIKHLGVYTPKHQWEFEAGVEDGAKGFEKETAEAKSRSALG